jgi:hypothetical protein
MKLPFKAYICYQFKDNDFDSSAGYGWYDNMFGRLMFERLRANHDAAIRICFEQQGSQIVNRQKEIEAIVNRLLGEIKLLDGVEFPVSPKTISAGKDELCLAIADYVAAIFKDYMANGRAKSGSWQAQNFDRIRSKVRWIHEYGTNNFFTRKHPFP